MTALNIEQVYAANPITTNQALDLMYWGKYPYGITDDAAMTYQAFLAQLGGSLTESVTGTQFQVLANNTFGVPQTGPVTLTLPQNIATTSAVQFNTVQLNTAAGLLGANGQIILANSNFGTAGSNNFLGIATATSGGAPAIGVYSTSTDANVGFDLNTKGTGVFRLKTGALTQPLTILSGTSGQMSTTFAFTNASAANVVTFPNASGTVAFVGGGQVVDSLTGTANQVLVNGTSGVATEGAITLTLPQSIATTSAFQVNTLQLNSSAGLLDGAGNNILSLPQNAGATNNYMFIANATTGNYVQYGVSTSSTDANVSMYAEPKGTGQFVIQTANATTPFAIISGSTYNHITTFAFANTTASDTVTFPDASFTVAGTALALGGTNAALTASNGGIVWSNATQLQILAGTATANLPLLSGSTATPAWGAFALSLGGALTTAGAHTLSGAFASTFTFTAGTSVTFPTSGTLATTSQLVTPAALTKTDDTNVTLTLGGSPTTALVNAASLTLGWTGTLSGTRGGTGVNNGASTITLGGNLTTSGAFATTFTMTAGTSVTFPTSGTLATTATASGIVNSGLINQLSYYAAAGTTLSGLATANNSVLVTSAGGVPSLSTTLPSGIAATNMNLTTPTLGVASATSINFGGSTLSNYVSATLFTPIVTIGGSTTGITYSQQNGLYTRIGSLVSFSIEIVMTSIGVLTGTVLITGLPFTSTNVTGMYYFQTIGTGSVTYTTSQIPVAYIISNSNYISVGLNTATVIGAMQAPTNVGATSSFFITGHYMI